MRIFRFSIIKPSYSTTSPDAVNLEHLSFIIKQKNRNADEMRKLSTWMTNVWGNGSRKRINNFSRSFIYAKVSDELKHILITFDEGMGAMENCNHLEPWQTKEILHHGGYWTRSYYYKKVFNHVYSQLNGHSVCSYFHVYGNHFLLNRYCLETLTPIETLAIVSKFRK